ncbi:MAG: hypothetical protein KA352_05710 [Flavobacteriales bacterium]|nr:hypothetical protein [Flavobacteriales bacterium]
MNRRGGIALLVAVAVVLGALREFLFVNLNYQLDHVARGTPFSYAHSLFQGWTQGLGVAGLTALKWAAAFFFVLLMTGLSVLAARLLFGDHRYLRLIAVAVGCTALLALLLHVLSLEMAAVKLLHALQYPVMLLALVLIRPLAPP